MSRETAAQMAAGVRKLAQADIGVSTTGIGRGRDGGTDEKPVGLVYVGVDSENYSTVLECRLSRGYRDERELIRYLASSHALRWPLPRRERPDSRRPQKAKQFFCQALGKRQKPAPAGLAKGGSGAFLKRP